jgi:hypothetical protein
MTSVLPVLFEGPPHVVAAYDEQGVLTTYSKYGGGVDEDNL